jgi:hypothetical protein
MNHPLPKRINELDWRRIRGDLDVHGHAVAGPLFDAAECRALAALWDSARFRSEIVMGPRRYGEGVYRYFAAPLPAAVRTLRQRLYARLAPIANDWWRRLGREATFPARLRPFLSQCHEAGQERPTPLLLRYERGGYNCLHQDRYGRVAFPLQAAVLLSRPGRDFEGGEFLLVEQRPRAQSRGDAIALRQGEMILFPNAERPVEGARGPYRAAVRHGVSRVRAGKRCTLGIIFHDAE